MKTKCEFCEVARTNADYRYCPYCGRALCEAKGDMSADDYQRAALRTASNADSERLYMNGVLGLCGESGEIADYTKKCHFHGHEFSKENVAYELGDVLWYAATLAHSMDYRLSDIFRMNVEKLYKRYPEGFDEERSKNRD